MNNQKFTRISGSEQQRKLLTVLRNITNNSLSAEQLEYILLSTIPSRQYEINVFTDPSGFCAALILTHSKGMQDRGKIVFGQALFGRATDSEHYVGQLFSKQAPAAAIITRVLSNAPDTMAHSILIYVPLHHFLKKEADNEQQDIPTKACI